MAKKILTGFKLNDIAKISMDEDEAIDWKDLYVREHERAVHLDSQIGSIQNKLNALTAEQLGQVRDVQRAKGLTGKMNDMRRAMASRVFSALIIREGLAEGDETFDQAERAVEGADTLIKALYALEPQKW